MKLGKLKIALQKMLAETFAQVSTNKGILAWDGDAEMPEVGDSVYSFDEEGNQISVEDGEYKLDDGTIIVVENGKVAEIRDPEKSNAESEGEGESQEDAPADGGEDVPDGDGGEGAPDGEQEAEEDVPAPEAEEEPVDERDARIAELEARIAELMAENEELRARIAELEGKPAAEPAEEEFKRVNKIEETGNKKLDRLARILNA